MDVMRQLERGAWRTAMVGVAATVCAGASSAAEWYVAQPEGRQCVPVSRVFPSVGPNPVAQTPGDAAEFARRAGYRASVEYLSPTRASLNTQGGGNPKTSWALFASLPDCHGFLAYVDKTTPARKRAQSTFTFGVYEGATKGVRVGVETKREGTNLVVVNKTDASLELDPRKVKVVSSQSTQSPCTLHMFSLMGLGSPMLTVKVEPGKTEGYMLGACPDYANNGAVTSPFIVQGTVQRVELGAIVVPVKPAP